MAPRYTDATVPATRAMIPPGNSLSALGWPRRLRTAPMIDARNSTGIWIVTYWKAIDRAASNCQPSSTIHGAASALWIGHFLRNRQQEFRGNERIRVQEHQNVVMRRRRPGIPHPGDVVL